MAVGFLLGKRSSDIKNSKELIGKQEYVDKHLAMFLLMNEWLKLDQEGKTIKKYFEDNNYKKIAIYGMGSIGERLCDELNRLGFEVVYAIDKRKDLHYKNITILNINEVLPEADVIIVSAFFYFDEISEELEKKVSYPIANIEDIIYEIV